MRAAPLGLALALLAGCGSSSDGAGAGAGAGAAGSPAAPAASSAPGAAGGGALAAGSSSAAAAAPSGAGVPLEGAPAAGTYAGTYKAKVGAMNEVPKDAKSKAWASDPGTAALGDGTISVTVVAGQRAVAGEAHGALGDQTINGELEGKALRARVDPNDPNLPAAMTGIVTGAFEGDGFKGVLRVAGRNGDLVREGAVTLTRK